MVTLKLAGITGMVTAVNVRFEAVCYEITYFVDGDVKTVWAREQELAVDSGVKRVGFNTQHHASTQKN